VLPPKDQVYSSIEGLIQHFELIMTNRGFEAPKGEVYGCIESGNGELGYYIVSAGENVPWRVRTRPPCYINYQSVSEADRRAHDQRYRRGAGQHQRDRGGVGSVSDTVDEEGKFAEAGPRLDRNRGHIRRCHARWIKNQTRGGAESYKDEWSSEQCGGCRFYIRLIGGLHSDWGVCSNAKSPRDGRATFEHDGCDAFVADSKGWT
jgi:uncharacterized protein YneR